MIENPRQLAGHTINYDPVDIKMIPMSGCAGATCGKTLFLYWRSIYPVTHLFHRVGPTSNRQEQRNKSFPHFTISIIFSWCILFAIMIHLQMDDDTLLFFCQATDELSRFGGLKNNWRGGLLFEGSTAITKWPAGNHFPRMQCRVITHQCHLPTILAIALFLCIEWVGIKFRNP